MEINIRIKVQNKSVFFVEVICAPCWCLSCWQSSHSRTEFQRTANALTSNKHQQYDSHMRLDFPELLVIFWAALLIWGRVLTDRQRFNALTLFALASRALAA